MSCIESVSKRVLRKEKLERERKRERGRESEVAKELENSKWDFLRALLHCGAGEWGTISGSLGFILEWV